MSLGLLEGAEGLPVIRCTPNGQESFNDQAILGWGMLQLESKTC